MPDPDTFTPKKPLAKRLLRWGLEALLFLAVLILIQTWQTRNAPKGPAPSLAGQRLDGAAFSLDRRPPGPLLVYFWATWCPVCKLTSGQVEAMATEGQVITVAMQSGGEEEVAKQLVDRELQFPVIVDAGGDIARAWGVNAVPAFYVLDRDNRIRHVMQGYTSGLGIRARMWLAE